MGAAAGIDVDRDGSSLWVFERLWSTESPADART